MSSKTEKPTPKKIKDAKKKGQIARSKELTTFCVLTFSFITLLILGNHIIYNVETIITQSLGLNPDLYRENDRIIKFIEGAMISTLNSLIPFFAITIFIAIISNGLLGGFIFSIESVKPKAKNINPIEGLKKLFSMKQAMEVVKSILKALIVGIPAYFILVSTFMTYKNISPLYSIRDFLSLMVNDVLTNGLLFSSLLIIIVAIDVPFQIINHNKQLKMSKQEIKDEYKNTEGNPEIKGRRRQMQYEMARKAKNSRVEVADIIITNPTHFSVGIKFDPKTMNTPIVVALGADKYAMAIRSKARELNIPMYPIPPLARVLYKTCKVGGEIPTALYGPMVTVLSAIYRLDNRLDFKVTEKFIKSLEIDEDEFK